MWVFAHVRARVYVYVSVCGVVGGSTEENHLLIFIYQFILSDKETYG